MITVLIRRDSIGPVFYRQQRIGQFRQPFHSSTWLGPVLCGRADALRTQNVEESGKDTHLLKDQIDPRITNTGVWLGRSSFDELPQYGTYLGAT